MASFEYPLFKKPDDLDTPIWRYMDVPKFVSMLDSSALYLSRTDLLGDVFEGSIPKENHRKREELRAKGLPQMHMSRQLERLGPQAGLKFLRDWTFVNCWHMNAHESAAMWRLYTQTNESIAIKTTVRKLDEQLSSNLFFGMVEYIDFEKDSFVEEHNLTATMKKRSSFSHENEIRVVAWKPPSGPDNHYLPDTPTIPGVLEHVDLNKLLSAIYVAPTSPAWFKDVVEKIKTRYGLITPVLQSSLDESPIF